MRAFISIFTKRELSTCCLVPPGSTCLQQEREKRSDERGARSPAKYMYKKSTSILFFTNFPCMEVCRIFIWRCALYHARMARRAQHLLPVREANERTTSWISARFVRERKRDHNIGALKQLTDFIRHVKWSSSALTSTSLN